MTLVETRYTVPGWGAGELWLDDDLVLAHDFHFAASVVGSKERSRPVHPQAVPFIDVVRRFLQGEPVAFDTVALDLSWATPFQRSLAETLRSIPRGEVVSYGELAALAGRRGAARAAGAFCAANRFAFVIPCHRVVAANGIGGYGATGLDVKRRLLALDGVVL